jgi:hypothetical protein
MLSPVAQRAGSLLNGIAVNLPGLGERSDQGRSRVQRAREASTGSPFEDPAEFLLRDGRRPRGDRPDQLLRHDGHTSEFPTRALLLLSTSDHVQMPRPILVIPQSLSV